MKQVIIKDIAREAGVFIASVSRALNGMDGISEKKRSRILRVCERLSYTPNGLARSLVKRRTQTIGIIMPDIMSPFYSELMVKASDAAHKRGYQVLLCNSFRELRAERDYLKLLAEHQVEGILIFPIGPRSTESMSEFIHNVPMVALNELTGQCGIPYVCADEEQAGSIAVVKNMPFASRAGTSNMLQISTELEEAAQVENAGFPRRFFKIVFPPVKGRHDKRIHAGIHQHHEGTGPDSHTHDAQPADAALYGVRLFGGKSDSAVQCSDHRYVCAGILRLLVCKYLYGRGHHQGLLMREDMKDEQN